MDTGCKPISFSLVGLLKSSTGWGRVVLVPHAAGLCVKFLEGSIANTVSLMLQVSI